MSNGKRQSALLVEIIIAVLFFALSATVILDVFATAYRQTSYAQVCNAAMAEAQNCAERIYISSDPEAMLQDEGFIAQDGAWRRNGEGYVIEVSFAAEAGGAGELRAATVRALRDEEELMALPCARYLPREVAQ